MDFSVRLPETIPIFPLSVVLFPGVVLPLHIFEERYKDMINDVLASHRSFGIISVNEHSNKMALTGCLAQIIEFERLEDGRFNIVTVGDRRFNILNLIEDKSYKEATVEYFFEDEPDNISDNYAERIKQSLNDILMLSAKLSDSEIELNSKIPSDPQVLSYWVPAVFYGSLAEKQRMLELVDTNSRLEAEESLLREASQYLAAKVAIKNAIG